MKWLITSLPDWYPVAFGVAYVLNELADDGIAVQAGVRTLIVAVVATVAIVVGGRRLTGHADRGPLLSLAIVFVLLAGDDPVWLLAAGVIAVVLLVDLRATRTGGRPIPWSAIRTGMTAQGIILVILVSLPLVGSPWRGRLGPPQAGLRKRPRPGLTSSWSCSTASGGRTSWRMDDITLVNVLPLLFGAYLGVDLPAQPNTVYFRMPGAGLLPADSAQR
jgi:hypothetical protein